MTIERCTINQGSVLKGAGLQAGGVCLEAVRQWVKAVINQEWTYAENVYDIISPLTISKLLAVHKTRNTLAYSEMDGYKLRKSKRRGGGTFRKFEGLRTRQDVIDTVMTVPGAYIYSAAGPTGAGHAFGFHSVGGKLEAFFDPNQGEFRFEDEDVRSLRAWWGNFWEGKLQPGDINYKSHFSKGIRELWRYELNQDEIVTA